MFKKNNIASESIIPSPPKKYARRRLFSLSMRERKNKMAPDKFIFYNSSFKAQFVMAVKLYLNLFLYPAH